MKKIYSLAFLIATFFSLSAQTTYDEVYSIFQTSCASSNCHNSIDLAGSLDLEGVGATLAEKQTSVHNNIYKATPNNLTASDKNNYVVYPGDPYRSFLFRKISNGFSDDNPLEASEGAHMPGIGNLSDYEKEVIRQWIVYGAKNGADDVDLSLVNEFYTNGGIESITAVPAPPSPSEGFQIHLGPFFIPAGAEVEFLTKYETQFDETREITKFVTEMGSYSHHFIVYKYSDDFGNFDPATVPYGLRDDVDFDGKSFVITEQYSNTIETPQGSAFKWDAGTVLDLNSHYINYSTTQILKCEVYLNVYTQDEGIAAQEMFAQLIPNTDIPIPNNGQEVTFEYPFNIPSNFNIYVWGSVAHTHKYGTDFNLYKRNFDGSRGEQFYDGGCANGTPGCAVENFDYQHLPFRFFEPFMPINLQSGAIAEASFLNDGPVSVDWGLTSSDEMMLFIIFFTTDTTGIEMYNDTTGIRNDLQESAQVQFYPNPVGEKATIDIAGIENGPSILNIYDATGKICKTINFEHQNKTSLPLETQLMNNGMYFYQILQNQSAIKQGKFVVNK